MNKRIPPLRISGMDVASNGFRVFASIFVQSRIGSTEKLWISLLVLAAFSHLSRGQEINFGDEWRYFRGQSEASMPTDGWRFLDFDEGKWDSGRAPFRYGDGTGSTVLNDMRDNYSSIYLRKEIMVESAAEVPSLILQVDYDDGFVIWINGQEALNVNGPDFVEYDEFSSDSHESGGLEIFRFANVSEVLVEGSNLVAVQVFNTTLGSSDIYFDLQMMPGLLMVEDTKFSVDGGFYDGPLTLEIISDTEGAEIYFTMDGSVPNSVTGTLYGQPLEIDHTTVIRAAAYAEGMVPTDVDTQTYLFLDDVVRQPFDVPGWPRPQLSVGQGTRQHDYEMDPDIVFGSSTIDEIKESLRSIPTISLVVEQSDMWDIEGEGGFYRGESEVPVSLEILYPNQPENNIRVNAGIQGHSHDRLKRSLRLKFKSEYGETKLKTDLLREAALNGDSAPNQFDRLILRAGNNRSWARSWNPDKTAYTMDQWLRDTQITMSGIGSHGTFVHVYINGLYWGLYNSVERPDTWFTSEHFGGEEEDWFAISHGGEQGGNSDRWDYLVNTLVADDLSHDGGLEELEEYLDVDQFIDYLLVSWYINVTDWPQNNWWAGNRNNPPGPVQFYAWDGEWSFGLGASPGRAWVSPPFRNTETGGSPPLTRIWHGARMNKDFMMRFADRAHLHLSEGGALSDEEAKGRWATLNNFIQAAIPAESARWGDAIEADNPRTLERDWNNEVQRIRQLMNRNGVELLQKLREQNYYPALNPPTGITEVEGEAVRLSLLNPNDSGSIYYTTDGSDPRAIGGSISSVATPYADPVIITENVLVHARVLSYGQWSALYSRTVILTIAELRITEIHYHPAGPSEEETQAGWNDKNMFEFVELKNIGSEPIVLEGFEFVRGIQLTFGNEVLEAGDLGVIVKNEPAFRMRYGDEVRILGQYEGLLDNSGEQLVLKDPYQQTIHDFRYEDYWIPVTDDGGPSLVFTDSLLPLSQWSLRENWVSSQSQGGSPEADEPDSGAIFLQIENVEEIVISVHGPANQTLTLQTSLDLLHWIEGPILMLDQSGSGSFTVSQNESVQTVFYRYIK